MSGEGLERLLSGGGGVRYPDPESVEVQKMALGKVSREVLMVIASW